MDIRLSEWSTMVYPYVKDAIDNINEGNEVKSFNDDQIFNDVSEFKDACVLQVIYEVQNGLEKDISFLQAFTNMGLL